LQSYDRDLKLRATKSDQTHGSRRAAPASSAFRVQGGTERPHWRIRRPGHRFDSLKLHHHAIDSQGRVRSARTSGASRSIVMSQTAAIPVLLCTTDHAIQRDSGSHERRHNMRLWLSAEAGFAVGGQASAALIDGAQLKVYPGAPHGSPTPTRSRSAPTCSSS
jgi:hypothetical protein